jgi:hypothetical protein
MAETKKPGGEYLVGGVIVDANGKHLRDVAPGEVKRAAPQAPTTKAAIIARLTELGVEHDPNAKKDELEKLLADAGEGE